MSPVLPVDLSGDTLFSTQLSIYDQPHDIFSDSTMNAFTHLNLDNDTSSGKSLVSSTPDLTSLISGMPQKTSTDNSSSSSVLDKPVTISVLLDQNNNLLSTAPVICDSTFLSSSQLTSVISADGQPLLIQPPLIQYQEGDNDTPQHHSGTALPPSPPPQDLDLLPPPPPPEVIVGELPDFADPLPPPLELSPTELPDFPDPLPPPPELVDFIEELKSPSPPPPESTSVPMLNVDPSDF